MAIAPTPARSGDVDPTTGRLLPLTAEELAKRAEKLDRALDLIDEITDESDTEETWREVFRAIDESRPHRPLFEGLY
jgi:hypothetical protein